MLESSELTLHPCLEIFGGKLDPVLWDLFLFRKLRVLSLFFVFHRIMRVLDSMLNYADRYLIYGEKNVN